MDTYYSLPQNISAATISMILSYTEFEQSELVSVTT